MNAIASFIFLQLKVLGVMLLMALSQGLHAQDLKSLSILTESYPPYNFQDAGQPQGIAVDLLLAASAASNDAVSRSDMKVLPWPRAYKMATDGPGVVLFATTRTEQRESLFQWAGPIAATRIVLLAKKSSALTISSADDIQKLKVGAIRDDIGEQLTKAAGVPDGQIRKVPAATSLVKMLDAGRIDVWAYEENVARWFIKQSGLNNADFETVYVLKEAELYYAFSNDVSATTVQRLQQGIDQIRADKAQYQGIVDKYL